MSLLDEMMEPCVFVDKKRTPDGEGGYITEWEDGAEFLAAIIRDSTMQARIAEQDGVTSVYTVTTHSGTHLDYHDVIKRKSDGKIFRITSDGGDKKSPTGSTLDIVQVTAEKWSLTS